MGTLITTMAENSALPLYIAHTILFATKATMLETHTHALILFACLKDTD